jgi:hypothetical protein
MDLPCPTAPKRRRPTRTARTRISSCQRPTRSGGPLGFHKSWLNQATSKSTKDHRHGKPETPPTLDCHGPQTQRPTPPTAAALVRQARPPRSPTPPTGLPQPTAPDHPARPSTPSRPHHYADELTRGNASADAASVALSVRYDRVSLRQPTASGLVRRLVFVRFDRA